MVNTLSVFQIIVTLLVKATAFFLLSTGRIGMGIKEIKNTLLFFAQLMYIILIKNWAKYYKKERKLFEKVINVVTLYEFFDEEYVTHLI